MILGLVGTSGAGKTTTAKYLKKYNFYKIELSSIIREEAKKRKITNITKKVLQEIGNELRNKNGPSILAVKAFEKIEKNKWKKIIIDGIRNLEEIRYLKSKPDFYLLGINAKPSLRFQRIKNFRGDEWIKNFNNFLKIEKRENTLGNNKSGLRVNKCLKKSSFLINNNSTISSLYKNIDEILKKIK